MFDADLHDRQTAMEERARERGRVRFENSFSRAQEDGRGDTTDTGVYLLKRSVDPVAKGIAAYVAASMAGKAGPKATAAKLLKGLDPHLLAYLTMTQILTGIAVYRTNTVSGLAVAIGRNLENEMKMAAFEEQKPGLYATVMGHLKERGSTAAHVERVVSRAANKYGVEREGWSQNERIHVGSALIDIAVNATGIGTFRHVQASKGRFSFVLEPAPEIVEWMRSRNAAASVVRPILLPMIVKPRPWRGLYGGGYQSGAILRTPVVKRPSPDHQAALGAADLTTTYRGLNAIQDTPWRVNRRVYDVVQRLWDNNVCFPDWPEQTDRELPPRPHDIDTNTEALRAWKEDAKAVYTYNVRSRSVRLMTLMTLNTARELADERELYFPHTLDFRGRCYARPTALNPQGTDLAKGLLEFAAGKPIGERGAGWLAIHGANSFGVDKVSHGERIDWVWEHQERILAVAEDPHEMTWWHGADAPFAFLAFCFEWQGVARDGLDHVSSLPIALDGSCNGIQHYSAMLRDPVGGAAVNLTPSAAPSDIYGEVAKVVMAKLGRLAADEAFAEAYARDRQKPQRNEDGEETVVGLSGGETQIAAQGWLAFGIDRKMTKRQVMVLPYGGTRTSCVRYTQKAVQERVAAGQASPFGAAEMPKRAVWLGGIIWDSIGEVVIAARATMAWLQKVARVATKAGQPLQWTTPSGFVAHQAYRETRDRRIKTRINGELVYFLDRVETATLDKWRQAGGIAPNFVHSLDASAMMLTIEMAVHNGVGSFAMIHDSYGTHAADTDTLATCLREAFVDMYAGDVLGRFRAEVLATLPPERHEDVPPAPARGDLDLALVLESPFFFT